MAITIPAPHALPDPRISLSKSGSGEKRQVSSGIAPLRKEPDGEAEQVNELRYGDFFTVHVEKDGWAHGQSGRDDYVGYVPIGALTKKIFNVTHRVTNLFTFLFPEPSIKSPPVDRLPFLSQLEVVGARDAFSELKTGGFVHRAHLQEAWEEPGKDPVAVAERMMDVPYLWGGVSPLGCDCSGLVQMALQACGIPCPRDSDMQAEALGKHVADSEKGVWFKRGDIVCFKGHIGFMTDGKHLLHANAHAGRVTVDVLSEVIGRAGAVTAVRRLG